MRAVNFRKFQYFLYYLCLLSLIFSIYYLVPIKYSIFRVVSEITTEKHRRSCDYEVEGDVLPSAAKLKFLPEDKIIFFHETSCQKGLNVRQACIIESAARLHPKWKINLLFSGPVTEYMLEHGCLSLLRLFPNVKVSRLHIAEYSKGTIVEEVLTKKLNQSKHPIEHAADILRIVSLHKFGGVYLDTDSLLVKNLDSLPLNWIGKQSNQELASGIMRFSKTGVGANITTEILREINNTFNPTGWSSNGNGAIQRVLRRLCPDLFDVPECAGVTIYPPEMFYPVYYSSYRIYFTNETVDEGPYMHHMWNYLSKNMIIQKDSPYAKLASEFCPFIYEKFHTEFGDSRHNVE